MNWRVGNQGCTKRWSHPMKWNRFCPADPFTSPTWLRHTYRVMAMVLAVSQAVSQAACQWAQSKLIVKPSRTNTTNICILVYRIAEMQGRKKQCGPVLVEGYRRLWFEIMLVCRVLFADLLFFVWRSVTLTLSLEQCILSIMNFPHAQCVVK